MTICLITAPTIAEFTTPQELSSNAIKVAAAEPQLGVLSLAAVLEKQCVDLRIVNLNHAYYQHPRTAVEPKSGDFAQLAALEIVAQDAAIYGFSSICSSYPLTLRIAQAVKVLRPGSAIVLGGPQASVVDIQTIAAFPFIDFVLRGEAEESLLALIEQLHGEQKFDQVGGLTYRLGKQPRRNPSSKVIANLDALPPPAYHITGELCGATTAILELGRGCPYACTFCSTNDFFRRNFRLHSSQRVLDDMRWIAKQYNIHNFNLVHDMFTVDRRRVAEFCEAMINSGESFTWMCSARTDCVDKQLLELMARGGCRSIFYGVEVGSPRMQSIIHKDLDIEEAKKAIDDTEELGIRTTVSLITGFPEETWDDVRQTVRMFMHSACWPSSSPQLNLLAPLAETPIHSRHKQTLVLDELCSDMSHQGCSQQQADLRLIREHPDIFPNFYLLPLQHLDRHFLLELREFMLSTLERFRWLVIAIDQSSGAVADFFCEWRKYRLILRPGLHGLDIRRYYRTLAFCDDFQSFVKQHSVAGHRTVKVLLDLEEAMRESILNDPGVKPAGSLIIPGCPLWWSDIPLKKAGTVIIELPHDIQKLIQGLRLKSEFSSSYARRFYMRREASDARHRIEQISDWLACILRNSDGRRDIAEVVDQLSCDITEIQEPLREYAFIQLLSRAHAEGFIDIYRSGGEQVAHQMAA